MRRHEVVQGSNFIPGMSMETDFIERRTHILCCGFYPVVSVPPGPEEAGNDLSQLSSEGKGLGPTKAGGVTL